MNARKMFVLLFAIVLLSACNGMTIAQPAEPTATKYAEPAATTVCRTYRRVPPHTLINLIFTRKALKIGETLAEVKVSPLSTLLMPKQKICQTSTFITRRSAMLPLGTMGIRCKRSIPKATTKATL